MTNPKNSSIHLFAKKIDKYANLQRCFIALLLTVSVTSCSVEEEELSSTELLTSESYTNQTSAQLFPSLANVFKVESTWGNGTSENEYWVSQTKDFFFVNQWDKLIMKCQGIESARTEVKEIGNHSIWDNHVLYYRGAVTGFSTSNELTIGQIHNHENGSKISSTVQRPLLRVYLKDGIMAAKISKTPYGSSSTYSTQTGPAYSSGNSYEIRLKILGDRRVEVLMKNTTTGKSNTRTFWVPTTWSNHYDAFYFKAGLYNDGGNTSVTWNKITAFETW